jgi:hypothetical protein
MSYPKCLTDVIQNTSKNPPEHFVKTKCCKYVKTYLQFYESYKAGKMFQMNKYKHISVCVSLYICIVILRNRVAQSA